ncbi:hypothetical protein BaRGS_00027975 [Batillaria attramentaria]|uniref:C-type lectin domain-containing protein n=1 Tax=Batillaria attramentaria TaxID=370345 RepID=A0ABD0K196_9CAEN
MFNEGHFVWAGSRRLIRNGAGFTGDNQTMGCTARTVCICGTSMVTGGTTCNVLDTRTSRVRSKLPAITLMACFEFILLLAVGAAGAASLYQELPGQRMSLTAEQADLSDEHDLQDRDTGCPDGWKRFRSSCYGIGDTPVTWAAAQEICEKFGAILVEVETSEEDNFLKEVAGSRGYPGLWLGGTDMFNEGHFEWASSRQLIRNGIGFTGWDGNRPDNSNNEDCLHLLNYHGYRWNDVECTRHQHFACEIK